MQTYQLLQQDNFQTTNQLIAFGISQFVGPTPIASVPAINAAITDLLSSAPFSAPTNARWINALFFTSMVLSLAAALFGIRAKQWLRKYMQWNSPLNTPRDNILVRQIRVEAWESWNIDVTISFIPALLELAMVLFLAGIVVLLWTLDDVVAKAVTTIVAVFLLVIAAFTVLPIFFKRSPYKSPISWAFVAAANTAASLTVSYLRLLRTSLVFLISGRETLSATEPDADSTSSMKPSFLARLRSFLIKGVWISKDWENSLASSWSTSLSTWRERDLDGARITGLRHGSWWKKTRDARDAAAGELVQELVHLDEDGNFTAEPTEVSRFVPVLEGHPEALLTDISQSALLVRALSWVQRESQDMQVSRYLRECISSLHPEESLKLSNISWYSSHVVADWCIASAIFAGDPAHESQLALLPDHNSISHRPRTVTGLRRALSVFADSWDGSESELDELRNDTSDFKLDLAACRPFWNNRKAESHILLQVLYADLQHIIALLHVSRDDFPARIRTLKRRGYELISVLNQALDSYARGRRRADAYYYIDRLGPVLADMISFSIRQSDSFPAVTVLGLKAMDLAYTIAKVTMEDNCDLGASRRSKSIVSHAHRILLVVSSGRMERAYYKTLLTDYFIGNFNDYGECKLNMYVLTVVRYFNYSNLAHYGAMNDILTNMVKAVEASAETYPDRVRHPDIDIDDRAWIYALCAEEDFLTRTHGPIFRQLLHLFEHHYREKNLTGDQNKIREYLHSSLHTAHAGLKTCEDERCRWLPEAHPCGPGEGYAVPTACGLLPVHEFSDSCFETNVDIASPIPFSPLLEMDERQRGEVTSGRWRVVPARLRGWLRRGALHTDIVDVESGPGTPAEIGQENEKLQDLKSDKGPPPTLLRRPAIERDGVADLLILEPFDNEPANSSSSPDSLPPPIIHSDSALPSPHLDSNPDLATSNSSATRADSLGVFPVSPTHSRDGHSHS